MVNFSGNEIKYFNQKSRDVAFASALPREKFSFFSTRMNRRVLALSFYLSHTHTHNLSFSLSHSYSHTYIYTLSLTHTHLHSHTYIHTLTLTHTTTHNLSLK